MANYQFHTYAQDILVHEDPSFSFPLDASCDFRMDRNLIEYSDDNANQVGSAYDDTGALIASGAVYVQIYAVV